MYVLRHILQKQLVCCYWTVRVCACMHACVGELQLAGGIGQYPLNRNQIFWIMPYPQNNLLVSIIQHICAFCWRTCLTVLAPQSICVLHVCISMYVWFKKKKKFCVCFSNSHFLFIQRNISGFGAVWLTGAWCQHRAIVHFPVGS